MRKLIKGDTVDEKIKSIDILFERLLRRSKRHAYALISPIPISAYKEEVTGPIIKFMSPADGKISNILFYTEIMPKAGIIATATISSGNDTTTQSITTKKKLAVIDESFNVLIGTRITVEVVKVKDEEELSGVWIAFLWTPNMEVVEVQQFLIDRLEEYLNAEETGATTEEAGGEEGTQGPTS